MPPELPPFTIATEPRRGSNRGDMQMSGGAKAGGSFLSGLPPSAGRMQKRCSAPLPSHLQKEEKAERTTSVDAAPKKKKSWLNKLGSAATKLKASQSFRKDRRKSQIEKPRSRTMSATTQPTKGGGWKRHLGFRKFSSSGSSRSETKDVDEVITKIFMHFDKTQTGTLSREEFGDMMKLMASGDDLKATLSTEVGRVGFLQHLQSEYSEGSLLCYEACVAFKAAGEPTDNAEGVRILDTYIKANGDDPINISSDERGVIEAAFAESARGGKPVTSDVFEFAEKALYTLMERDNHVRYKNHTRAEGGTSMMGYGAMIIVSRWPFFQSFGTLMRDMVVSAAPAGRTFLRWDLERATRLAKEARHIVNRIPAPPPGASRVYVRLRRGGRTIRLSRPSWNRPPLLEADVGDLLAALGPEHMCSVVCAVLAEMKIIVRRQREHRRGEGKKKKKR